MEMRQRKSPTKHFCPKHDWHIYFYLVQDGFGFNKQIYRICAFCREEKNGHEIKKNDVRSRVRKLNKI